MVDLCVCMCTCACKQECISGRETDNVIFQVERLNGDVNVSGFNEVMHVNVSGFNEVMHVNVSGFNEVMHVNVSGFNEVMHVEGLKKEQLYK